MAIDYVRFNIIILIIAPRLFLVRGGLWPLTKSRGLTYGAEYSPLFQLDSRLRGILTVLKISVDADPHPLTVLRFSPPRGWFDHDNRNAGNKYITSCAVRLVRTVCQCRHRPFLPVE